MKDNLLAGGIVYLTCHFVINVILSAFADSDLAKRTIFSHTVGEVFGNHTVQITPVGFSFMIWHLIYLWMLAGFVYLNVNIFRSPPPASIEYEDPGSRFYCNPPIFGRYVTLMLIINCFLYTAWLFLWDNELVIPSAVALIGIAVTGWIALFKYSVSLWNNVIKLKIETPTDLFLHRILLQNGLATYATWTTLASLINLAIALVHEGGVEEPAPSLIALVFLSIIMTICIPVELICWDNYFRYMITPLIVVLWALIGISVKQGEILEDIDESVVAYTMILTLATICFIIVRVSITIFRYLRRPLYIGLSRFMIRQQSDEDGEP